jgi:hypothetical protein
MKNEKTPVFIGGGGLLPRDLSKLVTLHRGETVLTNEQSAELLAELNHSDSDMFTEKQKEILLRITKRLPND